MPLGGYSHQTYIAGKARYHKGKMTPELSRKINSAHKVQMKSGKYIHPQSKAGRKVAKLGKKKKSGIAAKFGKKA